MQLYMSCDFDSIQDREYFTIWGVERETPKSVILRNLHRGGGTVRTQRNGENLRSGPRKSWGGVRYTPVTMLQATEYLRRNVA